MNNLETRIRNVAAEMEGKFFGKVPHRVFVEWDQTWDVADDLELTDDSTDEEIEEAIRHQEYTHDEYYKDEVEAYTEME